MKRFSAVSVDMFGTLVNVDSVAHQVWRKFLKDEFTEELGEKYWKRASELVFRYFDEQVIQKQQYISLRLIFEKCYSQLFSEIGLDFDPKTAANVLAKHHSLSPLYSDASAFLNSVGREYQICLSSDTDDYMLGDLPKIYPFEHIFTSDQLNAYKSNSGKKFFSAVIGHYGVRPERIIHIGDTSSDIIGANEAGIVTCWLNRNGRTWPHDIKPDYEVKSLIEAASILGTDAEAVQEARRE